MVMPQFGSVAREHLVRPLAPLREQAIRGCYWPNKKSGRCDSDNERLRLRVWAAARWRAVATKRRRRLSRGALPSDQKRGLWGILIGMFIASIW